MASLQSLQESFQTKDGEARKQLIKEKEELRVYVLLLVYVLAYFDALGALNDCAKWPFSLAPSLSVTCSLACITLDGPLCHTYLSLALIIVNG